MTPAQMAKAILDGSKFVRLIPHMRDAALIGTALYLPAEKINDVDFAVLVDKASDTIDTLQREHGYAMCGGDYDTGPLFNWGAVRLGEVNLMVTDSPQFFNDYKTAMEVCRALHLEHKQDRIVVCQIVRDKKTADQVRPFIRPAPPIDTPVNKP